MYFGNEFLSVVVNFMNILLLFCSGLKFFFFFDISFCFLFDFEI